MIPNSEGKQVDFEIIENAKDVGVGTVRRGSATCPVCRYTTPVASVRRQLMERRGGSADARLFAVVTLRPGQKGRSYRLPTERDFEAVRKALLELQRRKKTHLETLSLVPDESTGHYHSFVNRGPIYGMVTWEDYYSPRQVLALTTLVRLVRDAAKILEVEYDDDLTTAVQTLLALAVDKQADLSNALCAWEPVAQCPRHMFAKQAISMVWDFAEGVTTGDSSGSWSIQVERMEQVLRKIGSDWSVGQAELDSATIHPLPDDAAYAFVTDPPYYYSVQLC